MVDRLRLGKKGKEEDLTQVPNALAGTFFGSTIPDDVKLLVPLLHREGASGFEVVRGIATHTIEYLNAGAVASNVLDSEFIAAQRKLGQQNNEKFGFIYSGVFTVLKSAIASKVNTTRIVADLKKMNMPLQVADDLGQAIRRSRSELETTALHRRIRFPKLDKLRWRIDVVISSGSLSRVMRPAILFQLILSDGNIETFECSQEQFSQIRYGCAKLLRDMQQIVRFLFHSSSPHHVLAEI